MSTTLSEKSWNSSEDYEDDNSSTTTSSVTRRISGDLDIPGGVITTHCVSSVIKPGSKQNHDPLQFVKIQSTELSRKAVEQIRLAEEVKITKEKIKEVEEEWQNNLLNWKSKRRQSRGNPGNEDSETADQQPRRVKTFSEIIKEKAKSGQRIGYNLDKYIDSPLDDFESDPFDDSDVVVSKKEEKRENVLDTSSVKEPNCDENHENKKPNGVSNVRKEQDISVLQNVCNPDLKNDVHKSDKNFFDNLKNQPSESLAKNDSRDSTTLRNCSRWSQEVASGDEDEEFQENLEQDKDLEEKQALSFKAKLFAFENLAKPTESNNVLPRSSSRKNIDSKHGEMTQKEKIVTTKSHGKDRHTSDPTLNQCGQREQQHHNQHLFMQQQQPQQEQYQMQMNASRSPSESCSMSRDSNYEKKDVEQEVIRITEKNTKAGKNSSRISKALKTHDPQSGNLIPLQFDQKQYYLLDENCSDMSSAIPDDPDPFYYGNDEANSFKRQQLLNNQEHRAATLMHPPLSQQNHYMYHGQLHNDNVSQRSQANPGQDFYKTPKPLAQEKQIPNTLCPSQPLERQQFVYNPHNNGKPLSTVQHPSSYNLNHWLIQEAELRRQLAANNQCAPKPAPRVGKPPPPPPPPEDGINHLYENSPLAPQMFSKPEQKQQKRMLSVSGRKKCSSCGDELGRGCAAMVIESLSLYYHINCFRCSVCHIQLGNGTCGTDVRVRNHKLHCKNCYSNDEAGLKFSRV